MARVLCWALTLLWATVSLHAEPQKVLRVQLVLVAHSQGQTIPYRATDVVVQHMQTALPALVMKNVLRGDDRVILDFHVPPNQNGNVQKAIEGIASTTAGSLLKVEAWKPVIEELTSTAAPPTPPTQPAPIVQHEPTAPRVINFRFETIADDTFRIQARNVELGVILEALSSSTSFDYVCPQSVWQRRISVKVATIGLSPLLASLKGALDLSITRIGTLYVFAPAATGTQGG